MSYVRKHLVWNTKFLYWPLYWTHISKKSIAKNITNWPNFPQQICTFFAAFSIFIAKGCPFIQQNCTILTFFFEVQKKIFFDNLFVMGRKLKYLAKLLSFFWRLEGKENIFWHFPTFISSPPDTFCWISKLRCCPFYAT